MSGIEWLGERWAGVETDSDLTVYIWPPDSACFRTQWSLHVYHLVRPDNGDQTKADRWISIEITNLHFRERDWRRFENLEIRATSAWHDAHEETDEYGTLLDAKIRVSNHIEKPAPGTEVPYSWEGHDFVIRFGRRDGLILPCEIDGWLMPSDEYEREVPESKEEVSRFPDGPPNLRIMAAVEFTGGSVCIPRTTGDPARIAKEVVRDTIGCEEFFHPYVNWASYRTLDEKYVSLPGWSSSVHFHTKWKQDLADYYAQNQK